MLVKNITDSGKNQQNAGDRQWAIGDRVTALNFVLLVNSFFTPNSELSVPFSISPFTHPPDSYSLLPSAQCLVILNFSLT